MLPVVTIVGRPNVGKSTLFNRLIGERRALVMDTPGVTRDRNYGRCEWGHRMFTVIDTGGFVPNSTDGMLPMMRTQAELAIEEADVILFVVDARAGLTSEDKEVFRVLRNATVPVFVAANKVDSKKQENSIYEFHQLGIDTIYPIAAEHGLGVNDVIDDVVEALPPEYTETDDDGRIRVTIVGRPNVGKSTLVNQLLGRDRVIASNVPGTTRDPIDTNFDVDDRRYTLIDTAGVRRRKNIDMALEKFGVIKAFKSIERSHIAVLVCDATEGLTDQDIRIGSIALEAGRGLVIVLNKWDLVEKDSGTSGEMVKEIHRRLPMWSHVPIVFVSAMTGQRAVKVLELVDLVNDNWTRRIATGPLNRWFERVTYRQPPPLYKNRAVRMYYFTQARAAPPTFVGQTNMPPEAVTVAYRRYLVNQLRDEFDFGGVPLRITFRKRGKKDQE